MAELKRFGISADKYLVEKFDDYVKRRGYSTRSKAIEDIIRDSLKKEAVSADKKANGAIIVVYNHHKRNLVSKIVEIQHGFHGVAICNQHIHLDHNNCMEIIIVKGTGKEMQHLTNKLRSQKGVKFASLTVACLEECRPEHTLNT